MSENKLQGKFIRIPFNFFDSTEKINLFSFVSTKGFLLYTYLLCKQGNNNFCEVSLNSIQTFINRNYDKRLNIYYGGSEYKVELLKDRKTIIKFLSVLQKNKLIEIEDIEFTEDHKTTIELNKNQILIISVNQFIDSAFIAMPEQIFIDYIYQIGHVGWATLCLLTKLFNSSYGSNTSEGFANPSQEYISKIIKINEDTVSGYCDLMERLRLLKITRQEPILKGYTPDNDPLYEYVNNIYVVNHMLKDNKYYIGN